MTVRKPELYSGALKDPPETLRRSLMPLPAGTRFGPFEIVTLIGAGGMGEVYRARDTKLDRDVALKVLAAELTSDRDRIVRFEREAKTLVSLNHPHIAHV